MKQKTMTSMQRRQQREIVDLFRDLGCDIKSITLARVMRRNPRGEKRPLIEPLALLLVEKNGIIRSIAMNVNWRNKKDIKDLISLHMSVATPLQTYIGPYESSINKLVGLG